MVDGLRLLVGLVKGATDMETAGLPAFIAIVVSSNGTDEVVVGFLELMVVRRTVVALVVEAFVGLEVASVVVVGRRFTDTQLVLFNLTSGSVVMITLVVVVF